MGSRGFDYGFCRVVEGVVDCRRVLWLDSKMLVV